MFCFSSELHCFSSLNLVSFSNENVNFVAYVITIDLWLVFFSNCVLVVCRYAVRYS